MSTLERLHELTGLDRLRAQIESGERWVVQPYGTFDFTPGVNLFFAIVPKRGSGVQWGRDIIPALRRFIKTIPGFEKRPFMDVWRLGRMIDGSVSGVEGFDPVEALRFFDNRRAGKNTRLWVVYGDKGFERVRW